MDKKKCMEIGCEHLCKYPFNKQLACGKYGDALKNIKKCELIEDKKSKRNNG